jgi:hypothetical protein
MLEMPWRCSLLFTRQRAQLSRFCRGRARVRSGVRTFKRALRWANGVTIRQHKGA